MEAIVKGSTNHKELKFPKLMKLRNNKLIVLMSGFGISENRGIGTVIVDNVDEFHSIGEYRKDWAIPNFEDLPEDAVVELSNEISASK